jgi:hypothetical protein
MKHLSRFAPWINRAVLAAAALIFTTIGLRYIADPVRAAAATGVTRGPSLTLGTASIRYRMCEIEYEGSSRLNRYCNLRQQSNSEPRLKV